MKKPHFLKCQFSRGIWRMSIRRACQCSLAPFFSLFLCARKRRAHARASRKNLSEPFNCCTRIRIIRPSSIISPFAARVSMQPRQLVLHFAADDVFSIKIPSSCARLRSARQPDKTCAGHRTHFFCAE